jgi:hypothetical protein
MTKCQRPSASLIRSCFIGGFGGRITKQLSDTRPLFAGMPIPALKERFRLRFRRKPDEHYFYIEARPRNSEDLVSFTVLRVAIVKTTHLPRTVIVQEPNGDRIQWDFPQFETNIKPPVTVESVTQNLPQGCKEILNGKQLTPNK